MFRDRMANELGDEVTKYTSNLDNKTLLCKTRICLFQSVEVRLNSLCTIFTPKLG